MLFEYTDEIFVDAASRFGVTEGVVENVILAMVWAGERALETASLAVHLQTVVKRTLLGLSPKGEFAKHIAGSSHPLSTVTTLAICTATHRLCLWFRAHEVSHSDALANYFETAFSYYAEYWKSKSGDEVMTALSMFDSKLKSCRNPRPRGRSAATASNPTAPKVKRVQSGSGDRTGGGGGGNAALTELPQMATINNKARATRPLSGHPRLQPRQQAPSAAASLRRNSSGGTSVQSPPRATPKFSSSLDVDVGSATQASSRPQTTKGRCVQMAPRKRDTRRPNSGDVWIVLARGRALSETPLVAPTDEEAAKARRAILLCASAEDVGGAAATAMPSPAVTRRAVVDPALRDNGALLLDDDADETNWWTRRYDSPEADSDFEPEHSDGDPNSDIEDTEIGEEEGKPNALDSYCEEDDTASASENDDDDEDEDESDGGESGNGDNSEDDGGSDAGDIATTHTRRP
eukprot:m.137776 g.137776  ORF g.137776 m.137776 type:complete len:463 (+) comp22699_c0_seq1:314-1702(+)